MQNTACAKCFQNHPFTSAFSKVYDLVKRELCASVVYLPGWKRGNSYNLVSIIAAKRSTLKSYKHVSGIAPIAHMYMYFLSLNLIFFYNIDPLLLAIP